MSSGTPHDPHASSVAIANASAPSPDALGMSARQRLLSARWSFFRAERYDGWKVGWDGKSSASLEQTDVIASSAVIPDGFVDMGGTMLPAEYRKPTAPYNLVRLIVLRFSSLLFGAKRHPKLGCQEDADTEDFATELARVGSLWARMHHARNYGGGMGTVAVGFVITNGLPAFEVHDARWCTPTFRNRFDHTLRSLEKRFAYPIEERDPETGEWVENWYWYRRLMTENEDVVWDRVPVGDGVEPAWDELDCDRVAHNLGEVQAVWIQNQRNDEGPDGDPDTLGEYDSVQAIDRLTSTAIKGSSKNADPTVVLKSELEFDSLGKGSDNAIQVEPTGDANYMEIAGTGIDNALRVSSVVEDRVCRTARVVLEKGRAQMPGTSEARTATEAVQDAGSMHEQVGVLQEQYGENGVKKLMGIALRTCRKYLAPKTDASTGRPLLRKLRLSKRKVPSHVPGFPDMELERSPGFSDDIELKWPPLVEPSMQDVQVAVTAAVAAVQGGLVDKKHAAQFIASYFQVEDVDAMLAELETKLKEDQAAQEQALFAAGNAGAKVAQGKGVAIDEVMGGEEDEDEDVQPASAQPPPFQRGA